VTQNQQLSNRAYQDMSVYYDFLASQW